MNMLFSLGCNPDSISVQELAEAFNNIQQEIQLPAFQRDNAWDEAHTELLWNSIFRGFPISSLLFAQTDPQSNQTYKVLKTSGAAEQTNQSSHTKFILIDGQQRSRAVALGLKPWEKGDGARLWVDLGKIEVSNNTENRFYVCSLRKPWGTRTTDSMIREGIKALQISDLPIDGETLGKTWPMRAVLPVPLAELMRNMLGGSLDWTNFVPSNKQKSIPSTDLENLLKDLKKTLSYLIPVYLINNPGIDDLGIIFERLNKQGVAMSEEDRFFSALKIIWPQAHDLVWEIYSDYETGRTLSPTKIVHLAVRLSAASEKTDELVLNAATFKRFVKRQEQGVMFLDKLKTLMQSSNEDSVRLGLLHKGLRLVRSALIYDPTNGIDDPGLPMPLAARLKPYVWHTLAAWSIHHDTIDPKSRLEMLRYVCLDHFFSKTTASDQRKIPFEKAYCASEIFPGRKIYEALVEKKLISPRLFPPDEFQESVCLSQDPTWGILQNELDLVLWAQRSWMNRWFPYFDPTIFTGQDLPYDIDHIIPSAHLDMRGRRYNWPPIFWSYRQLLLQSPGNMRFWPKSLNRADGKVSLEAKYILGPIDGQISGNPNLSHYGLNFVGDIRKASIVDENDLVFWEQVNNKADVYDWSNKDRIFAFRHVVDNRRSRVYRNFFDQLGFSKWS
jgi:hypothetical protein